MENKDFLEQQAVEAAINSDWKTAVKLNNKILVSDKKNLSAYLRLGFAYLQTQDLIKAKKNYKKVLKIQPKNKLAQESIERIKILENKKAKRGKTVFVKFDPNLFLEVPGKTKSINLVKLGQKNILAQLTIGQLVNLKAKKRKIEIRTQINDYIGSFADDISKSLYLFIKNGNQYVGFIQDFSLNNVTVFIKEIKKGKKYAEYTSFTKDVQNDLARLQEREKNEDSVNASDNSDVTKNEIDDLAEDLSSQEEKIYLPYSSDENDEDDEE